MLKLYYACQAVLLVFLIATPSDFEKGATFVLMAVLYYGLLKVQEQTKPIR